MVAEAHFEQIPQGTIHRLMLATGQGNDGGAPLMRFRFAGQAFLGAPLLFAGAAGASSLIVITPPSEERNETRSFFHVKGIAGNRPEAASATMAWRPPPLGRPGGQNGGAFPVSLSRSVIAFGGERIAEGTVIAEASPAPKPIALSMPMVIRGGIVGDAFPAEGSASAGLPVTASSKAPPAGPRAEPDPADAGRAQPGLPPGFGPGQAAAKPL